MGPRSAPRRLPRSKRPARPWPTYIRFVCFRMVEGQRSRLGLFQAIDEARHSEQAADWALLELRRSVDWFNENLEAPDCYERPLARGAQPSLSWFKASAERHIQEMFALKTALEHCGLHVEVLRTRAPGRIIFEDEHQIAAEPLHRRF